MEGFLLGLSSGTSCLAHCAPVIVPHLLGEANTTRGNILSISVFLSGRLAGYLLFALIAWALGGVISDLPVFHNILFGTTFVLLSIFLAYSGLADSAGQCTAQAVPGFLKHPSTTNKGMITILLGICTGINFCPPFLLAFSSTASGGSLMQILLYFFTFFLGTSLYFIPISFLGGLKSKRNIQAMGKMMSVIMAAYFLYKGLFLIASGLGYIEK